MLRSLHFSNTPHGLATTLTQVLAQFFALALALVLVPLGPLAAQDLDGSTPTWSLDELAVERYVQARHEADLLQQPGVVGVGIGLVDKDTPGLLVLVEGDPQRAAIPATLDGVPVRVEQVVGGGVINGGSGCVAGATGCHDSLFSMPVPMGTSTSTSPACDAGTLGFKACDDTTGEPGYVTAMHVATRDATLCEGTVALGTAQLHRGNFDAPSCSGDFVVGLLERYVPVTATGNLVDAAFVASNDSWTTENTVDYPWTMTSASSPSLGSCVVKSGRTTGYTPAKVNAVNLTWTVNGYCLGTSTRNKSAQYTGLFRFGYDNGSCGTCANPPCWDVALGGDSGSAVYHRTLKGFLMGLLFANANFSNNLDPDGVESQGIASPAATVFTELDLVPCW